MIKLETQFVSGEGGFSQNPLTYTQIARNDNFAVYERSRDGHVRDYETIKVLVDKAGKVIFQTVVAEDTEKYPSTSQFGQHAWSYHTKFSAMEKFNQLTADLATAVADGEVTVSKARITRPDLVIPNTTHFTMNELEALNPDPWNRMLIYVEIQKKIKAGAVKEDGHVEKEGKGKKPVRYATIAT